jgi:hypothetical protein
MKTFTKTTIQVEVISEEPIEVKDMEELHWRIMYGNCSGIWSITRVESLDNEELLKECAKQGTDPSYFLDCVSPRSEGNYDT